MTEKDIKEKWGELLQYAMEHATGEASIVATDG